MQEREKVLEIVQKLNIMDDTFFQKMAEDIGFCEEMISTILGQKVIVKRVVPQNSIKNLQGRSVVLDALCILENGAYCNVEVQKLWKAFHNFCYAKLLVMSSYPSSPYVSRELEVFSLHNILLLQRFFFNQSIKSSFSFTV